MSLKVIGLASTFIGAIYGCLILSIAFDHNPQGETFDQVTGAIHFDYVVPLFLMVSVPVTLVAFAIGAFVLAAVRHLRDASDV